MRADAIPALVVLYGADGATLYAVPAGGEPSTKATAKNRLITMPRDPALKDQDPNVRFLCTMAQSQELRSLLIDAIDSLEYVAKVAPELSGYGVRAERIEKAKAAIAKAEGRHHG
jgi:hypothetical protein